VGISVGPITVSNVTVGVGLRMSDENDALLGQSFLSKFDISIIKNQLVLRSR
jgi:aspartyl protease family protein